MGERVLNGQKDFHSGYDLVGIGSWDVTAAEGGTVVQSRMVTNKSNLTWQWGNYVCIRTDAGQYHYYCHLASRAVCAGQTVRAGEKLGVMGNTGYSFGAHLHFEVRAADGKQLFARNPCWESRMRPAPIRCRRKRSLKRIWRRFCSAV